jgi:5-methyltetrahydrofolate--homocysteine methyltransferase
MGTLKELAINLENGQADMVAELTHSALESGLSPRAILDGGLIAGMTVVGSKFKAHQIFLPDVLLAAKAMYAGLDILKPLMIDQGVDMIGKVVIGTVQGDLHDIGKNLVSIMLKGAGFEVIDLGNDVTPERFLDAALESNAKVIGMSALLTTTMPAMKKVIELARQRGVRDDLRFIIGGAPVNSDYARDIGADAYCFDGIKAVESVKEFLGVS